jgi:hypothetical protein
LGLRDRIRKLEQGRSGKTTLLCTTCGQKFVVYGENPQVEFLLHMRKTGYQGSPYREPPEDIRLLSEHEHDPSLMIDKATGESWVGSLFAGNLDAYNEDAEDLSEQAQK